MIDAPIELKEPLHPQAAALLEAFEALEKERHARLIAAIKAEATLCRKAADRPAEKRTNEDAALRMMSWAFSRIAKRFEEGKEFDYSAKDRTFFTVEDDEE